MKPEVVVKRMLGIYDAVKNSSPAMTAGTLVCNTCGNKKTVDTAHCLRHGWPKCCGYTMRLISPPLSAD